MKTRTLWRFVACATIALLADCVRADSYKWLCPKCGGTWWTGSPLDNSCPRCPSRTYGKEIEHTSDAASSISTPAPSSSGPNTWQMLREMRKGSDERRKNFTDFMAGLAEKRMANREELMRRARSSNFNLAAALASVYQSLPPAVQANLQDERSRKLLEPQMLMQQLADKQEETYEAIINMVKALQGPSAGQALAGYWNQRAAMVARMTSSLEDKLENSKMLYVEWIAVRPFDSQYQSHSDAIQGLFQQKMRSMGMNPDRGRFDPQKHLTPAQQQLRAEVLARGGMQVRNAAPQPNLAQWNGSNPFASPPVGGGQQQPQAGLVLPTQQASIGRQGAATAGGMVTQAMIESHLAERKATIDGLIALMTPEALQNAGNAANQTLNSFIGRQAGSLVSQAEVDAFWSNQMWNTGNRQDVLVMAYYAVCVMSFVDPKTDAKLDKKIREVNGNTR